MNKFEKKLFDWEKKFKNKIFNEQLYATYEEALKACSDQGYENHEVVELVKEKGKKYRDINDGQKYPEINTGVLVLLDAVNRLKHAHPLIVIYDLGGADGIYYLQLRKSLGNDVKLLWCVIETAEMANAMKELETDELKFYSSIAEAKQKTGQPPLIFHTSGTIQYTPDPYYYIREICNAGAKYLVFNRQSLNKGNQKIISIQTSLLSWHGAGIVPAGFADKVIKYPHTNIPQADFEKLITEKYAIVYIYQDSSGVKKVNKENITGTCYFCEIK